jgi:energy-coupling factor transport system ATP-binding protein
MARRVPEALAAVGLAGFERRHVRELSGGQQQRLALAGVLAPEPGILVFDEPTANLDPGGAAAFLERIADLRARRAATIVLIDHRLEAAWALADRVLALGHDGAPIAEGAPAEVLSEAGSRMEAAGIWLPEAGPQTSRAVATTPASVGRPIVDARALRYGYDPAIPVVRDVDLQASEGERVALVGPNGSGKSTLGRLLVGLLVPQHGAVLVDGRDPARLPAASLARLAGYVFQRPEQRFLALRVTDEISLGLRPAELDDAAHLMDRLGLPLGTFGERSPYGLSGGEQRRLSLACALVRRPSLLILDEPTYGQDRRGYEALLEILRGMVSAGTCLIAATHDERFVRDVASRVLTLDEGWLAGDAPAASGQATEAAR